MRPVLLIALKDLRLLTRDRAGFFWVLGWPFVMALFFGSIFSGGNEDRAPMSIAAVDLDQSAYSRAFFGSLKKSAALRVVDAPLDSARTLVRQGRLVAYVALSPGVGRSLGFGGDAAAIELGLDPSRRAEAGYLEGLVTQALFTTIQGEFSAEGGGREMIRTNIEEIRVDTTRTSEERRSSISLLSNLERFMTALDSSRTAGGSAGGQTGGGASGGAAGPNIKVVAVAEEETGPRNAYEFTFPSAVMWALVGVCMSFAISIVSERISGTFLRLRLAPISRSQVLAGKGLAAFLAALTATTLLLLFAAAFFKVRVSNPAGLAAALIAASFCFTGLMMLISVIGRTHQAVAGAGWAILLIMSMTGGGMVPLIAMPSWMLAVSNFSLVKWGVLAVEGAIWRGFTPAEMALPLGILFAVGVIGFAIGARVLNRSET